MFLVYKHTTPNGKVYIGITSQEVEKRWLNGFGYVRNKRFFKAIQKYGWDNIRHEVVREGLSQEEACTLEQELIKAYDSTNRDHGYNCTCGGDGTFGYKHTEESKQKMRLAKLGSTVSVEARKKMSMAHKNMSQETREKIGAASKGRTAWNKGKHHTQETREKMSNTRKGKKLRAETCEKISASHKKPVLCVESGKEYESVIDAARETQINKASIYKVCKRQQETAGGFHWVYV